MSLLDQFFVYHPYPWEDRDWAKLSALPLEEVWFPSTDGQRLFGWYVEQPSPSAMLVWCHGNAGNMTHRLDNLQALYRLGLSVFLFDYRGYGRSQGRPSEEGLYSDAVGRPRLGEAQRATSGRGVVPVDGRTETIRLVRRAALSKRHVGMVPRQCRKHECSTALGNVGQSIRMMRPNDPLGAGLS